MEKEQMSDVYRRIKKKRARERRRRQRRILQLKLAGMFCVAVAIIVLVVHLVAGKSSQDTIYGADSDEQVVNVANTHVLKAVKEEMTESQTEAPTEVPTQAYPSITSKYKQIPSSELRSPYLAVYCVEDRTLVAGRKSVELIYPASMTKVMTLIVAVENLESMEETFEMTADIIDPLVRQEASRAGFDPGEIVSAKDLLYGLTLPSGADSAEALAIMVAGSSEEFVKLMNEKCYELGLRNTHFVNTSGLHDSSQYSTPLEIAIIMEYAMANETCAEFLSTYQYTTAATPQHPEGILLTSTMFSRMVGDEPEEALIIAGKTGYTTEAGNCLVSYAQKGDKHYIAVSAGAENRWHVIYDAFDLYDQYAQ